MSRLIGIKVTVLPDTDEQAATVMDRLGRVLAGLAMENIGSEITFTPYEHQPEDEL